MRVRVDEARSRRDVAGSRRKVGGHVRTSHDLLADGLYADVGAEHFYRPIYKLYWGYIDEFRLPVLPYSRRDHMLRRIDGKWYTPEDLRTRRVLSRFAFSEREIRYLAETPWGTLRLLYFEPYVTGFKNESQPFGIGLDHLDQGSVSDLLKKDGASAAAVRFAGGSSSALDAIWQAAIKKLRGAPFISHDLYRIRGGNQRMTNSFAQKLGERIHLGAPVTSIHHGATSVTVGYREFGEEKKIEADYLACCMSLAMLRLIAVSPAWPERKAYVIRNMAYWTEDRVVFQSRTPFWEKDHLSPNIDFGAPTLRDCWRMAEEVDTRRAVLIGTAAASSTANDALSTFRQLYPGISENFEQAFVVNWGRDPWAMACERTAYLPGQLPRFWPEVTKPCGRVFFAGCYATNMNMGQESALESAMAVAESIDRA